MATQTEPTTVPEGVPPQTIPVTPDIDPILAGRDARITVYLEPELAAITQHVAGKQGVAASAWIRDLIFNQLLLSNKIPHEMLVRLARRA